MRKKALIIAEVGNSHEGSVALAKCFIKAAAECGVDVIKFQTHIFEAESLPNAPTPPYFTDESRESYFRRTAFDLPQWTELRRFAEEEAGLRFISSPFSIEAVEMLEEAGVSSYKIASGEVANLPLLARVGMTGKPVFLSSGMSSWRELDEAVAALRENGCGEITLLQCTSEYPCPPESSGLNILGEMKKRYGLPVGLSDHTLGAAVAIAAVCLGAVAIEKHFALSKRMYGPDPPFSAEPDDLAHLVRSVREVERALGSVVEKDAKASSLGEMKRIFEKSVVAATDAPAGTVLEARHLAYKKPGDGIPASRYREVLGKRLVRSVRRNEQLHFEDLSDGASD